MSTTLELESHPMVIKPTPVHRQEFSGPACWTGKTFSDPAKWSYKLSPAVIAEIRSALAAIKSAGKTIDTVAASDFPLPSLEKDAPKLRKDLAEGSGFVLVTGMEAAGFSEEEQTLAYWGVGSHLGVTLPQNVKLHRIYSVRNEGASLSNYGQIGVRFSKTKEALSYHTDSAPVLLGNTPDVVALLALHVAKVGGDSAIASAEAVHNVILKERPDLLERLYQPYYIDRRAELREGESSTLLAPVFTCTNNKLEVRYFPFYIPKGYESAGKEQDEKGKEALTFMEEVMNREGVSVYFSMKPAEMQFVNNRFILHSRTGFDDWPEPERRRHLVRLWLKFHGSTRTM